MYNLSMHIKVERVEDRFYTYHFKISGHEMIGTADSVIEVAQRLAELKLAAER